MANTPSHRKTPPRDVVVMSRETVTPTLRAGLRASGLHIPPALARLDWGPALIREPAPVADAAAAPPPAQRPMPRANARPAAPPEQQPAARADQPSHELLGGDSDYLPSEELMDAGSDDGGFVSGEDDFTPANAGYAEDDAGNAPAAYPGAGYDGGDPYAPPASAPASYELEPEPETRQIDVAQANAIAAAMGESTTQASHRAERLDLSEWGFLMRVVMIAGPDDPEPRRALDQLVPTIGEWLRNEVSQPARLEYDRRFRHEIQKQLSRFLTEHLVRFPVIKAELQYIE